eukprot:5047116-Amphidinium_carterae.1
MEEKIDTILPRFQKISNKKARAHARTTASPAIGRVDNPRKTVLKRCLPRATPGQAALAKAAAMHST